MSSRDAMLTRIRSKVSRGDEETRRAIVDQHLAHHRRNLIPERGIGDDAHRLRVFTEMMEVVGGSVEVLDDINDVPHAVADYLRNANLPAHVRRGGDSVLAKLPWHRGTLEVAEGRAQDSDRASITRAFAGVAESGTIIQVSGPDNPTTLNFLPEVHIVVLEAANIFASYEDAWSKLRNVMGEGVMPRTVNMISGPSRTGDIEQTIVRPAHGPKNMHVIIVR
jgi:L-lactate dehydrogenase complex protein LldG